jgi:hypothetical protein
MKTELQKQLAKIAPSIFIETLWEHDPEHCNIREDCDGFDDEDPEDWQAWQSEVRATCIHEGDKITGSAYLSGTWEKAGDDPAKSNPTISGYERQMTAEALEELAENLPIISAARLQSEVTAALAHLAKF